MLAICFNTAGAHASAWVRQDGVAVHAVEKPPYDAKGDEASEIDCLGQFRLAGRLGVVMVQQPGFHGEALVEGGVERDQVFLGQGVGRSVSSARRIV